MPSTSPSSSSAGVPSPPVSPGQTNETCTCVNITWDIPEYDGAAELLDFELQVYPQLNSSLVRTFRAGSGDATSIDVCDLIPNDVYNASITAINAVGPSTPVNFELLIVAREPLPPVDVVVESICNDPRLCFNGHVLATWKVLDVRHTYVYIYMLQDPMYLYSLVWTCHFSCYIIHCQQQNYYPKA